MDGLLLIAVIVVAVTVGKPLSYLDCQAIGSGDGDGNAYYFTMSLGNSLNQVGGQIDYNSWIGTTKATCFEMKSIWGLSIALWLVPSLSFQERLVMKHFSILFAFSTICSICLWRRKPAVTPKDIEG